jgi:hypothetical protein
MPIKPLCDKCGGELNDFGGLILSPPDSKNRVKKYHLCKGCFNLLEKTLAGRQI